ncbi:Regulator of microtubule dynamics protein 2 [Bagarius yarrelli]|uniref:Regulator of microtubule dynamics protein 2 n=1 Tax=Bagarius yarrelli TaxID=175774 RepID=A0A556TMM4_BAGYA|nr:Regulator of microtubule dynamics protein 2 [Bagarius yarrelli]
MAQEGKVLALGVLAGAAGIGLAAFWYQSRRATVWASGTSTHSVTSSRNADLLGGGVALQTGQAEVLDRLGALIQCVSDLKEEVKALKNALPHLQDHIRDELTGRSRKASPLNRSTPTRRKRASDVTRGQGLSSEEAESEGGYITALTDTEDEIESEEDRKIVEPLDELTILLQRADGLHACNGVEKKKGLCALLEKKEEDHLDKAIELRPQDPLSYYLLGRWCYATRNDRFVSLSTQVAQCTWIERKIAATLFGEPPSATVHDALQNFLKAEEICPKYSKYNYVFLAKCYKDLGQKNQAKMMCNAASDIKTITKDDEEAQKELDSLLLSL